MQRRPISTFARSNWLRFGHEVVVCICQYCRYINTPYLHIISQQIPSTQSFNTYPINTLCNTPLIHASYQYTLLSTRQYTPHPSVFEVGGRATSLGVPRNGRIVRKSRRSDKSVHAQVSRSLTPCNNHHTLISPHINTLTPNALITL